MTVFGIDIMWAMVLLGVALFTGCIVVFNPVMHGMRRMGVASAYAVGAWMALALPWRVALTTWCVFAAAGGAIAFVYEWWARRRYAASGRAPRPLVALRGFVLWPAMIPDAIEGVLVDVGVLAPSGRDIGAPRE